MRTFWQSLMQDPDPALFEQFFEEHKALVWTICVRHLGAGEDAEEAFQSAWTRLVAEGRAGQVPDGARADEWLCRLAGREADALRKRRARRRHREMPMPLPPESVDSSAGAAELLADAQSRAALEVLVAELPEKLRLPVQLHYFNGLTQRQIAAALGVPASTVDSRLAAARKKLLPMADRAGLRDALGVLIAGGMMAGLLAPPSSLCAASILAAGSTAAVPAVAFSATKILLSIAAVIAVSALVLVMATHKPNVSTAPPATIAAVAPSPAPHEAPIVIAAKTPESASVEEVASVLPNPTQTPKPKPAYLLAVVVADRATGKPITGARVQASSRYINYEQFHLTDREGIARFNDAPGNSIQLCVEAENYARAAATMQPRGSDLVMTLDLVPGTTLHGKVTGTDGHPIDGVRILFGFSGQTACHEFPVTGVDGAWECAFLPQGDTIESLSFYRDGYRTKYYGDLPLTLGVALHEVNIQMEVGRSLSGIVVDAGTGAPIPNARVGTDQWEERASAKTDASGRFELPGADGDRVLVHATGYAPVEARAVDESSEMRIALSPGRVVAGHVVDSNRKPIAGAQVQVNCLGWYNLIPETTNALGAFRVDGISRDAKLQVLAEGWPGQPYIGEVAGRTDLEIVLRHAAGIRGQVVDAETKQPIERFTVRLGFPPRQPDDISIGFSPTYLQGISFDSADGRFSMGTFPEGSALAVHADAEGYQRGTIDRHVVSRDATPLRIEMKRLPDQDITGRVTDANGAPIARARVALYTRNTPSNEPFSWDRMYAITDYALQTLQEETSADGSFRLRRVAMPADADLIIQSSGYARFHLRLAAFPQEPMAITLDREARLRIHVNREIHPRIEFLELFARPGETDAGRVMLPTGEEYTEAGDLPARTFLARAYSRPIEPGRGYEIPWSEEITFTPGETLEVEIGEDQRFKINGRVVEEGMPCCANDIVLFAYDPSDPLWGRLGGRIVRTATVSPDGNFQCDDLEPGSYLLNVISPGNGVVASELTRGTAIAVKENGSDVVLTRHRGGSVNGVILSLPKGYLPNLTVTDDSGTRSIGAIQPDSTDGRFEVIDLPAGNYAITLPDGRIAATFQVETGSTVDLGVLDASTQ